MTDRLVLASLSGAMDGGLTAIAEVAEILADAGKLSESRLIGGVAALLHQQRLSIDVPLRATGDAGFGLPPDLRREPDLVTASRDAVTGRCSAIAGNDPSTPFVAHPSRPAHPHVPVASA